MCGFLFKTEIIINTDGFRFKERVLDHCFNSGIAAYKSTGNIVRFLGLTHTLAQLMSRDTTKQPNLWTKAFYLKF